jgi:hypothetical protein
MLPILATIASGIAWFAATAGQLIMWGAGISVGFWVGKKITDSWDQFGAKKFANRLYTRHSKKIPEPQP